MERLVVLRWAHTKRWACIRIGCCIVDEDVDVARLRGKLYEWKLLHNFALLMAPSGLIAVLAGWITTEVGRQPWTIQGLLRTTESASPLAAPALAVSLLAFIVVYFAVFGAGVVYILKLMAKPPVAHESAPPHIPVRSAGITPLAALRPDPTASH